MPAYRLRSYLLLLTVSVIWGVAAPVIKFTLGYFDPLLFLTYRFFISALIAVMDMTVNSGKYHETRRDFPLLVIHAFLSAPLTLGLLFLGMDRTESVTTQLIALAAPVLLIFLAAVIFRERVTGKEKTGVLIASVGTALTVIVPLFADGDGSHSSLNGNLIVLLAFIFDSLAALLLKYLIKRDHNPMVLSHMAFIIGFFCILPLFALQYSVTDIISDLKNAPAAAHLGVLFMSVLSGTVAYAIRAVAIKSIELSEATVFGYLNPLWGIPLSVFWLGERIDLWFIIGAVFIITGVIIAESKNSPITTGNRHRSNRRQRA